MAWPFETRRRERRRWWDRSLRWWSLLVLGAGGLAVMEATDGPASLAAYSALIALVVSFQVVVERRRHPSVDRDRDPDR